jgi:hypothetical protein
VGSAESSFRSLAQKGLCLHFSRFVMVQSRTTEEPFFDIAKSISFDVHFDPLLCEIEIRATICVFGFLSEYIF